MKIFKTLSVSLMLTGAMLSSSVYGKVNPTAINFAELPAKTVCLKHPAAENTKNYFSSATLITFEVYKVGSKEDINKVISTFKNDAAVESISEDKLTGDFQAFTLSLKSAKDKAWFAAMFKKAGLNSIRINNKPVVDVNAM